MTQKLTPEEKKVIEKALIDPVSAAARQVKKDRDEVNARVARLNQRSILDALDK